MCAPWDTGCLTAEVADVAANTLLGQLSQLVTTAEEWVIQASASWWVMVPSISLYPNSANTDPDAAPITAVAQLHALIMPITVAVATGGMIWNGILMALSRKPAPLVNVLRGLWNTALWTATSIFATQLLLASTDALSDAIMGAALRSVGNPSVGKRLSVLLVPVNGPGGLPVMMVLLVSSIAMFCATLQALLMFFRDGSILILAAIAPLAASGGFANATNGWKNKVLSWWLSLLSYKVLAAMVYATEIYFNGENTSTDPRVMFFGLAMMVIALVALPVVLKFFTWTVGSLQSGNGGLGMVASAGAAGMHATTSLLGGFDAGQHARYLSDALDGSSNPGGSAGGADSSSDPGGPGPGGPGSPSGRGPGSGPGGAPGSGSGGGFTPPAFTGDVGVGKAATVTSAGGPAGAASAAGSATGAASGSGAAAGAAGGAGSGAAMGAAAATGPAAPVVAGAVVVAGAAVKTGKAAATAAADALDQSGQGT